MTVRTNYHTHNDVIKEQTVFIRGLSIDWNEVGPDSYLRGIEAINELDYLPFRQPITFFVGENGSGKSTLLEAIAIAYGFTTSHAYSFSGSQASISCRFFP
jgi:predicted ATPase